MIVITLQKKKHEELLPGNVIFFFLIGISQPNIGTNIVKYSGPNVKLWEEWLKLVKHR